MLLHFFRPPGDVTFFPFDHQGQKRERERGECSPPGPSLLMHASDIVKCEDAHTRTWMELEGMYDYYVFVMQHVRMNNIFDFLLYFLFYFMDNTGMDPS